MSHLMATLKPYLNEYGPWAVFGVTLLENLGIPMPGQTMLIAGALLASQGDMPIAPLLLATWAAAVTGSTIGYSIGLFGGRALVLRFGHHVWVTPRRLERVESFFQNHGGIVVVGARFVEVLRQLNGIAAGVAEMPWRRFLFYNALGGALWVGFWGMLAYQLGERVIHLGGIFKRMELFILAGIFIAIVVLTIHLVRRRKR